MLIPPKFVLLTKHGDLNPCKCHLRHWHPQSPYCITLTIAKFVRGNLHLPHLLCWVEFILLEIWWIWVIFPPNYYYYYRSKSFFSSKNFANFQEKTPIPTILIMPFDYAQKNVKHSFKKGFHVSNKVNHSTWNMSSFLKRRNWRLFKIITLWWAHITSIVLCIYFSTFSQECKFWSWSFHVNSLSHNTMSSVLV